MSASKRLGAVFILAAMGMQEPRAEACGPLSTVCTGGLTYAARGVGAALRAACTKTMIRSTMCGAEVGRQLGFAPARVSRPDAPWFAPYPGDRGPHRCDDSYFWLACIHMR
jgi:hypothetical protein